MGTTSHQKLFHGRRLRRLHGWDTTPGFRNNFPDIRDRSNRSLIDFQFPKDGSGEFYVGAWTDKVL